MNERKYFKLFKDFPHVQKVKNLIIIGTSHIAQQSIQDVKSAVLAYKPKVIAIELDQKRLHSLLHPQKRRITLSDIRKVGFKGFLFNILAAWAEKKLGKLVSTPPGSEMKTAIALAKETNSLVALIDQDINITLRKLSKNITLKEKFRFIKDIILSIFIRKKSITFDLTKVPDEAIIKKLTLRMKKEYPSVHKILIEERNLIMAKALYKIMNDYKEDNVVAVVGAGHEKDIANLIKKRW